VDARNGHNVLLHRYAIASGNDLGLLDSLEMVAVTRLAHLARDGKEGGGVGDIVTGTGTRRSTLIGHGRR